MKKAIQSPSAPAAIGPYSQGIQIGDFAFFSGQIPIVPSTGQIEASTIEAQTEQCISNIQALLAEVGCTLKNVIKTTVFLSDMDHFSGMNEVYSKHFSAPYPARSTVAVKELPKKSLVEIEVVVHLSA